MTRMISESQGKPNVSAGRYPENVDLLEGIGSGMRRVWKKIFRADGFPVFVFGVFLWNLLGR